MKAIAKDEFNTTTGQIMPLGYEKEIPSFYVVSRQEFEELQLEHSPEVEGLSYDEYCEIETECWHNMLKEQLMEPWEKLLPESLLNPGMYNLPKKYLTKKPILRKMILTNILAGNPA